MNSKSLILAAFSFAVLLFAFYATAQNYSAGFGADQEKVEGLDCDQEEIEAVWVKFLEAVRSNDKKLALSYFNPEERERYRRVFDSMGDQFSGQFSDSKKILPINIGEEVALYSICLRGGDVDCEEFPIYFVKNPELGWVLAKL